jgi:hypothetical protein
MNTRGGVAPKSLANDSGGSLVQVGTRLRRLRRERHLVEKAISALTLVSRGRRQSRDRRATRT